MFNYMGFFFYSSKNSYIYCLLPYLFGTVPKNLRGYLSYTTVLSKAPK